MGDAQIAYLERGIVGRGQMVHEGFVRPGGIGFGRIIRELASLDVASEREEGGDFGVVVGGGEEHTDVFSVGVVGANVVSPFFVLLEFFVLVEGGIGIGVDDYLLVGGFADGTFAVAEEGSEAEVTGGAYFVVAAGCDSSFFV